MNHDFEDIEVKRNAADILEEQLRRKRRPSMISTGSMCDPYIPLEEKLQVTRECLEVIERHGFGIALLTKSTLVLRDLDILQDINRHAKCVVQTTFTTYDEKLCRMLEPHVATTFERFEMLQEMHRAKIPTVVWLGPFLPYINDSEDNLRGILDYCVKAHVQGILCFGFGMTLRAGNREYYYEQLDRLFPGLKDRYITRFGDAYSLRSKNSRQLQKIFVDICRTHEIMHRPNDIWDYLTTFPPTDDQLSLF